MKQNTKKEFVWAILACAVTGTFGAVLISRDTSGYVASMTFFLLFFFCVIPLMSILFAAALIAAFKENGKFTGLFLMCVILLPLSFIGSMKLIEFAGLARYKYPGAERMRPLGSENKERIVIEIKKEVSQAEINKFDTDVLRKSIPRDNGVFLDFGDGICGISYPNTKSGKTIIDVPFCDAATEKQKSDIKKRVSDSAIVQKFYERLKFEEIESL